MTGDVRIRQVGAGALLLVTVVALTAELTGATGTWRLAATTLFVVAAPGWAIVAYARSASPSFQWAVGVATSIAIGIILGEAMVLLRFWHPEGAVVALGVLTLVPLGHHLVRGRGVAA